MEIDRRGVLTGMAGLAGALALDSRVPALAGPDAPALYAATRKDIDGGYSAVIFDSLGNDINTVPLPARGHDIAVCRRNGRCVAFARRPGNFAVAFSAGRTEAPVWFTTPPDRHFYGHGVFSPDGRLLLATENDFEAGEGRLGIYNATDGFKRIGEFSAHGIGPHDLALLADGVTLVIANGGIATHPDQGGGREPLNPADMEPSLVYADLRNGDLLEKHALPDEFRKTSIRHLDIGASGRIIIGCQLTGRDLADLPLILRHRRGGELAAIPVERELAAATRGYISSVAADRSGELAALTSSKGGLVLFADLMSGRVVGSRRLEDVSGVAGGPQPGAFLLTSGLGALASEARTGEEPRVLQTRWHWDNHAAGL
jgi:hypothetical protein